MTHSLTRIGAAMLLAATIFGGASGVAHAQTKPALIRNVDEGALQPFQISLLPHSSSTNTATDGFTVPAGKRLAIEYYSAQAQDLSGGAAGMTLSTQINGNSVSYIVYISKNDTNAVNQTARIYADPGTFVQVFAFNTGATCGGLIAISGYLVDIP